MSQITFEIDLSALREFVQVLQNKTEKEFSNLHEAVNFAGNYFVQQWIETAKGRFKHTQGGYALGITEGIKFPFNGNALHFRVEHTKPYAYWLEHGYDPYDMKKMLETSSKVRISKQGHKYLVIPFRHGNPESKSFKPMPVEVYEIASDMTHSRITGTKREGIQQGAKDYRQGQLLKQYNQNKVKRNIYSWGQSLTGMPAEYKNYEGMYRFQSNPNKNRNFDMGKFTNPTSGGQNYSTYITFRVMSDNPKAEAEWMNKGLKPMNILGDTIARESQNVKDIMKEGLRRDMNDFIATGFRTEL